MKKSLKLSSGVLFFSAILMLASFLILVFSFLFPEFALGFEKSVSSNIRYIQSFFSSLFSFSFASFFTVLMTLLPIFALIVFTVSLIRTKFRDKRYFGRAIVCVSYYFSAIFLIVTVFILSFGVLYAVPPTFSLSEDFSADKYKLAKYESLLAEKIASIDEGFVRDEYGATVSPFSKRELCERLQDGFVRAGLAKTPIRPRLKRMVFPTLSSFMHITGIYMPTGETLVNFDFPEYASCYSAAHELAHQYGIAREGEANFAAYLALINSGDEYLAYCGYINMFEYIGNVLYYEDPELYAQSASGVGMRAIYELYGFDLFFEKYRDSTLSKISDGINDTYLKTLGEESGSASYGEVVLFALDYFDKHGV